MRKNVEILENFFLLVEKYEVIVKNLYELEKEYIDSENYVRDKLTKEDVISIAYERVKRSNNLFELSEINRIISELIGCEKTRAMYDVARKIRKKLNKSLVIKHQMMELVEDLSIDPVYDNLLDKIDKLDPTNAGTVEELKKVLKKL